MSRHVVAHGRAADGVLLLRCAHCGAVGAVRAQADVLGFQQMHEHGGYMGLGDMVAAATKSVGIQPCGACQKRQAALNRVFPKIWR